MPCSFKISITTVALFLLGILLPTAVHADIDADLMALQANNPDYQNEYFLAEAISVTDRVLEETGIIPEQHITAIGLSGLFKGKEIRFIQQSIYGIRQIKYVKKGDVLILNYTNWNDPPYRVVTHYRIPQLMVLLALFVAIVCALTRRRGIKAIIALAASFALIYTVALPLIKQGYPALWVLVATAVIILSFSIFIAHGFKLKSFIAVSSGLTAILFATIIGSLSIYVMRLSGTGMSEAEYLQFGELAGISLRGLLLGGIILSTVGVLDDVTTVQTITVEELLRANPNLTKYELYKHAMNIGREHIISMVNTLFIVFAGSSIPVFLYYLFDSTSVPLWVKINNDDLMEEVIRSLTGSLALVLAVPFTTIVATHFFSKQRTSQQEKKEILTFLRMKLK